MKKYPIFVMIILLCLIVLTSGCVSDDNSNETKSYSGNNISFVYNGSWDIANTSATNSIVAVGDPRTVDAQNSPSTFVIIQKPNETVGNDLQATFTQNYASLFNNTSNQRISEANITVNGNRALENVYMTNSSGVQRQIRAVWLTQNNVIYVILCGALPQNFDREQNNFDLVVNSFKAQ